MEEQSRSIMIDPSVLNERSNTYSSLTDINGIDVFTNKYEEKVKGYNENAEEAFLDLKNKIFIEQINDEDSQYEEVKTQLFINTQTQGHIMKEEVQDEVLTNGLAVPVTGIMTVIFVLFMFSYFGKRKSKKKMDMTDGFGYE